jgi:hypothetical protein
MVAQQIKEGNEFQDGKSRKPVPFAIGRYDFIENFRHDFQPSL